VHDSRHHVAPPSIERQTNNSTKRHHTQPHHHHHNHHAHHFNSQYQLNEFTIPSSSSSCKFPKWLNKKWHNLKQTKLYTLDYRLDSFLVLDEKSSIIINKYTCAHMRSKKSNHVQAIVKSLNGWWVFLFLLLHKGFFFFFNFVKLF
jgi:hypothetical protein